MFDGSRHARLRNFRKTTDVTQWDYETSFPEGAFALVECRRTGVSSGPRSENVACSGRLIAIFQRAP